jgi:hypothetical protein
MDPISTKSTAASLLTVTALGLLAACGNAGPGPSPTTPGSTTTSATSPAATHGLVIAPGRLGDVRAGMTKAEWSRTGKIAKGAVLCPGEIVHWKADPTGQRIFVYTRGTTITQLSVKAPGPSTAGGIQVGSTYAELRRIYGTGLTKPEQVGWDGDAQVYAVGEEDGRTYIGFQVKLAKSGKVTAASTIDEIAVTDGTKPGFAYDC